jgi:tetratricopeptide (TPR) repeat protein
MVLHGWEQRNAKMVIEEARELWMIGDKPAAIEQLRNYCIKQPDAIPHNEILAKWLWLVGQEREAINWMIGHHQYHCNQRMHETLGQWYAGAGNYEQSSIHLHTSLYITPHLLHSRALLADYYYLIRNLDSARYWAKEVLYTPPKIENAKASELKRAAANWLLPDHPEGLPFQLLN